MSRTTTYAYDLSGNIVKKAMGNGVSEVRTHDGRNRVGTLQNVPVGGGSSYLSAYAYGYDLAGNVMQVAETYPGGAIAGRTITNTYDGVYRLVNESIATSGGSTVATVYAYDKGHNRVSQVVSGGSSPGTTSYAIGNGGNGGAANQVLSATLPDSSVVGFSYDANGNRTQRAYGGHTDVYSYDYDNRLVSLDYQTGTSGTTGMYDYSYDYRTRRVVRTEPATGTTQIVFDGGTSIEEFGASGPDSAAVEYLRGRNYGGGVGGLEYSVRSGSANFNQYDSRGDVVAQTNAAGAISFQTAYEGFGEQTVSSGGTADRQKANTKENDPTGLLNEGFRYRDLETGTFISRDPIGTKLMHPTDRWFLDGKEVLTEEFIGTVGPDAFKHTKIEKTAKDVDVRNRIRSTSNSTNDAKPGERSQYHFSIRGEPNIYMYAANNPWTNFDPEGLILLVAGVPSIGGLARHTFVWSTEYHTGTGMHGTSGTLVAGDGCRYLPDGRADLRSCNVVKLPPGMSEKQAINLLKSYDMHKYPWIPVVNDCHTQLHCDFNRAQIPFPGVPGGRWRAGPDPGQNFMNLATTNDRPKDENPASAHKPPTEKPPVPPPKQPKPAALQAHSQ